MTSTVLLDTSALLALVIDGAHRSSMLDAVERHETLVASAMALTEALPAIDRLTDDDLVRNDLEDALRLVWDHLHVVPLDARCLDTASRLARERMMRLSDAIHFAAADRLPRPTVFATVDPAQIAVALDLGYEVWST